MNDRPTDQAQVIKPKQPYTPPELVKRGSLVVLTQTGGSSPKSDTAPFKRVRRRY